MWQYADVYLAMPTYANSYHLYSDNIPLIPYVLKGCISYYGDYLNFNSLGEIGILRYLDYGCLPSYILTNSISHELKYTDAVNYFTTAYSDWKDEITRVNKTYQEGFSATMNATIYSRYVPEIGVVIVTYESNIDGSFKTIIINYTDFEKTYLEKTISPKSYVVTGGKYV